jgi:dipeptide transport system substrate-binding protein
VKWHSNAHFSPTRDFNADDVIFMFERQWKEDHPFFHVSSSNHSYFKAMGLPRLIKAVERVDEHTVRVVLTEPKASFLSSLAMAFAGVQSQEYADAMLKAGTPETIDRAPIGTGPFAFVGYEPGKAIRFRAFAGYWRGRAKIEHLVYDITPHAVERWAKLQKGDCHVMPYPDPEDLQAMRRNPDITVLEQAGLNVGYLAYNTTRTPFNDVRVRKALNMAIDKSAILAQVYQGTGIPAINPIPPTQWSYNPAVKDDPYDPAAARQLVAEAGYPQGFDTELWAMPVQRAYNPAPQRVAAMIQADLARIGVRAEIKTFEWGEYYRRMTNGEHPMGLLGWTGDNGDPDNFLHTLLSCEAAQPGGANVARFCHQPFDDLVLKAKVMANPVERAQLYEQAQVVFKEQAPWFTIAHSVQLVPERKEVLSFRLSPFGHHNFYGVELSD